MVDSSDSSARRDDVEEDDDEDDARISEQWAQLQAASAGLPNIISMPSPYRDQKNGKERANGGLELSSDEDDEGWYHPHGLSTPGRTNGTEYLLQKGTSKQSPLSTQILTDDDSGDEPPNIHLSDRDRLDYEDNFLAQDLATMLMPDEDSDDFDRLLGPEKGGMAKGCLSTAPPQSPPKKLEPKNSSPKASALLQTQSRNGTVNSQEAARPSGQTANTFGPRRSFLPRPTSRLNQARKSPSKAN